jgi:hypothetical protein
LPPKLTDFDTLEAEIDTIKLEVQDMRADLESRDSLEEPCAMRQQHECQARAEASKIPAPATSRLATARSSDPFKTGTSVSLTQPPGTGLISASTMSCSTTGIGTGGNRGHATFMISPTSESSSSTYATCTTAIYHDAVEHLTTELHKMSPHFAQQTQAATRRVKETLRKATSPAKSSPETTPGKSTRAKAPDFATDKRAAQRGQKRTSLPDGWMSSPDQISSTEKGVQKKEQVLPGSCKASNSAYQSSPGPALRKKTSSYMSPTKAAQNRSIATIGEDKRTRISPRAKTGALRINTNIASKDSHALSSSSSRSGNGSDESSISPRSHSGFVASKKESSSPLRNVATAKAAATSAVGRPSLVIRLPMPLPHVANTTVTHRNPNEDLLDPIKEKLGKEDLLRRDSTQESSSTPVDRSRILAPVFARLNRIKAGEDGSPAHSMRSSGEAPRASAQPRARDSDNEPISRLISGLRGQSSAEIGKALAEGQPKASNASSVDRAETNGSVDLPVVYQSRKRSGDPAILYQGRKPSTSHDMPQDPAIVFNSGPLNLDKPSDTTNQRKISQPGSLRATATYFVPGHASDPSCQTDPPMRGMDEHGDFWCPKSLSLFDEDDHVDHGTGSLSDMGFLPEHPRRHLADTWHGLSTPHWQDEWTSVPAPEPQLTLSRHFDLIHGDTFDTPTVSPRSDDTSSPWLEQQRQRNLARWEITGQGRRKYHWTGGGGLEISFKSIGPDAEHDPNSPVWYRNYRENTKTYHLQAGSYPKTHAPGSPLPPNAPKLMRGYAERMAFSQIPCNEHQWTGKYHLVPAIMPATGLCDPCKQVDSQLHRVGGGIELF